MPPKKATAAEVPNPEEEASLTSTETSTKKTKTEKAKPDADEASKSSAPRKVSTHPSTMEMVKEALKELDSRKGSSAQAIRSYILEKYSSVDAIRLKYMLRKALAKGLEGGVLVRPPNSSGNGAQGRFRLVVKVKSKEAKVKTTENSDPNVGKTEKAAVKAKGKAAGSEKKPADKKVKTKSPEDTNPSSVAAAKRPKAKKPVAEGSAASEPPVPKAKVVKVPKAKVVKVPKAKAPKADGEPGQKTKAPARAQGKEGVEVAVERKPGKRGKKAAE